MRRLLIGLLAITFSFAQAPSSQAGGTPDGFSDLVERVMPAVVNISTGQATRSGGIVEGVSLGSGFIIDSDGYVVTNHHVIQNSSTVTVTFDDGTEYQAEIVGSDIETDIAVLKITSDVRLPAVKFGDSSKVKVGDWVVAIGQPFGLGGSVSAGIISGQNRRNITNRLYDDFLQTDAAINKGNSGGPLFAMDGRVIGVNTIIYSQSGGSVGVGFAVPSSLVDGVVRQLIEYGETQRGYLGVLLEDVTEDDQTRLGLSDTKGALVVGIPAAGGPAAAAGMLRDDVIVRFNGMNVGDSADLTRAVANTPVGQSVVVVVLRGGERKTLYVTVARRENRTAMYGGTFETAGLTLSAPTSEIKTLYGLDDKTEGVVVTHVSPSNKISRELEPGDVILEIGWDPVNYPQNFEDHLTRHRAAGTASIPILVQRDDRLFRAHIIP